MDDLFVAEFSIGNLFVSEFLTGWLCLQLAKYLQGNLFVAELSTRYVTCFQPNSPKASAYTIKIGTGYFIGS